MSKNQFSCKRNLSSNAEFMDITSKRKYEEEKTESTVAFKESMKQDIIQRQRESLGLYPSRRRPLNPVFSSRQTPRPTPTRDRVETVESLSPSRKRTFFDLERKSRGLEKLLNVNNVYGYGACVSNRVVITKKSTFDIALLPPKRSRLDEFDFFPSSTSSRRPEKSRPSYCLHPTERYRSSSNSHSWKREVRSSPSTEMLASRNFFTPRRAKTQDSHCPRDGVRVPPFTVSKVHWKSNDSAQLRVEGHGPKSFPWWEKCLSLERFRDELLSGANLQPEFLIETEEYIMIKFNPKSKSNNHRSTVTAVQERSKFFGKIIMTPVMLAAAGTILRSVLKWITGY